MSDYASYRDFFASVSWDWDPLVLCCSTGGYALVGPTTSIWEYLCLDCTRWLCLDDTRWLRIGPTTSSEGGSDESRKKY